ATPHVQTSPTEPSLRGVALGDARAQFVDSTLDSVGRERATPTAFVRAQTVGKRAQRKLRRRPRFPPRHVPGSARVELRASPRISRTSGSASSRSTRLVPILPVAPVMTTCTERVFPLDHGANPSH